jgi:hypothetical protein
MDSQIVQTGGLSAGFILASALLYKVYKVINHHRIRGRCCGKAWDASIDIDESSPTNAPTTTVNPALASKTTANTEELVRAAALAIRIAKAQETPNNTPVKASNPSAQA